MIYVIMESVAVDKDHKPAETFLAYVLQILNAPFVIKLTIRIQFFDSITTCIMNPMASNQIFFTLSLDFKVLFSSIRI